MVKFLLPSGRVHSSYLKYLYWNSFSNFVASIESVLSTHSMLTTVGGANAGVNVSINFIGKDIIGQMGSLYAINKIGKYIAGSKYLFYFCGTYCVKRIYPKKRD